MIIHLVSLKHLGCPGKGPLNQFVAVDIVILVLRFTIAPPSHLWHSILVHTAGY